MTNTFVNAYRKRHREVVQVLRPELDTFLPGGDASGVTRSADVGQFAHSEAGKAIS